VVLSLTTFLTVIHGREGEEAHCVLENGLKGTIVLQQKSNGELMFSGEISGLTPGKHGFHVHQNGSLGNSCKDAGGHYNPNQKNHGSLNAAERHEGDFGNIVADNQGVATISVARKGSKLADIINRAIVVHAGVDDLGQGGDPGSLKTGNAGARLDCCLIQLKNDGSNGSENMTTNQGGVIVGAFLLLQGLALVI